MEYTSYQKGDSAFYYAVKKHFNQVCHRVCRKKKRFLSKNWGSGDLPSASHNTHIEDMIKSILNMLIDRL